MADYVIRISEAEAARDFASVLARVRAGAEVVIESGKLPVAVIHAPAPPRRLISECIALLPEDSPAVMDADFAKDVEAAIDSPMYGHLDRNPHHHIPPDFQERSRLWMASATNLITENAPFIYTSVENLMFAERYILRMEKTLVRQSSDPQPLLLKECAAHSILWLCGLYEVIRVLKQAKSPKFVAFSDLHNKLHVLRIPLAKHEVSGAPGYRNTPHYPTSVWSAETGRVGWQAFNPVTNSPEVYFRTDLADEFLAVTE